MGCNHVDVADESTEPATLSVSDHPLSTSASGITVSELKRLLSQVPDNTPVIVTVFKDEGPMTVRSVYDTAQMRVQPVRSGSRGLEIAIEVDVP